MEVLYGLHPIEEALRANARRIDYVLLARDKSPRLEALAELCRSANVRVSQQTKDQLTKLAGTDAHQGAVAAVRERKLLTIEDLLAAPARATHKFLLALDGVEDPHNLGALLRSADGAGVDGILLPERRTAPISAVVAKTSAGASEHVPIARVTNITRSLEQLKRSNIWIIGLDERGTPDYTAFDFRQDCCLVLGAEGAGLHDLVKRTCDHLLRIPMLGSVASLNVSVAGAVVMYEALRQRTGSPPPSPPQSPPNPAKAWAPYNLTDRLYVDTVQKGTTTRSGISLKCRKLLDSVAPPLGGDHHAGVEYQSHTLGPRSLRVALDGWRLRLRDHGRSLGPAQPWSGAPWPCSATPTAAGLPARLQPAAIRERMPPCR